MNIKTSKSSYTILSLFKIYDQQMQNIFNTFFLKQITIKYILNVWKMHGPRIQIFKLIWAGTAELLSFPLQISFNILVNQICSE